MTDIPVVKGIVLSQMPVSEYDKRLSILTKERGRITAFARGARKVKSKYIAASNPFSTGTFELYEGRNSYTLGRVDIVDYFDSLSKDLKKAYFGLYFCEVSDYFAREAPDEGERVDLLYRSLKALEKGRHELSHIKAVYEFKTMVLNGEYPDVFSMEPGDDITKTVLYALQFIASKPAKDVYNFYLKDGFEEEFLLFVKSLKNKFFEHSFKSEEFLMLVEK